MPAVSDARKVAVVVPTIRAESIAAFLRAWRDEFEGCDLIVVEDNPERSFDLPDSVTHYAWCDIERELGSTAWIIPRRTDCVRSFGYWMAYQRNCDVLITLDDDCYPEPHRAAGEYLQTMLSALAKAWPLDRWWNTLGNEMYPRGFPYTIRDGRAPRRTVLHHGLWSKVADLDAATQLLYSHYIAPPVADCSVVPHGKYFPMCGMNVAVVRDLIPAFYFLLMGRDHEYDRFGDIWCGLFVKRIADHLGMAVSSGGPSIEHQRASNVWANLRKEAPGLEVNEHLWRAVDRVRLTSSTVVGSYRELAEQLDMPGDYFAKLRRAMMVWSELFQ